MRFEGYRMVTFTGRGLRVSCRALLLREALIRRDGSEVMCEDGYRITIYPKRISISKGGFEVASEHMTEEDFESLRKACRGWLCDTDVPGIWEE